MCYEKFEICVENNERWIRIDNQLQQALETADWQKYQPYKVGSYI